MLLAQIDELRATADEIDWEFPFTASRLRGAADTIWQLRALVESYGMIANEAVCDYYDRDEMLADANATACELGIEVGA